MSRVLTPVLALALMLNACGPAPSGSVSPSASPAIRPSAAASPSPSPLSSASPAAGATPASLAGKGPTFLKLSKTEFEPGEKITVSFAIDPMGTGPKAWIGLIQADVPHGSATENDKYDMAYEYLEGRTTGEVSFNAPADPGDYDLRLHDSDESTGRELFSIPFKVMGSLKPLTGNALRLNKSRYAAGEEMIITVSIKAEDKKDETAWLGIVPAAVEHGDEATNDRYNLGYKFIGKLLYGQTILPAPQAPGLYDIRLHDTDSDGRELAFISFVVE